MQGQYEDEETGLYYNRFRYYDPNISAYVSQDPLGLIAGENVYSYVGWIDPLGLSCSVAKKAKWTKPKQGVEGPGIRDHYKKHGEQVGANNIKEYDTSARQTIQNGQKFKYKDRATGEQRIGYYDKESGLFTATDQTKKNPIIKTHFPESWENLRKLPGFSIF